VFGSIAKVSRKDSVIYLKHRSFFSYLGAHRYSTVNIPWGHVLLTDREYERFVNEHCLRDSKKMIDFFFNGLTYPRMTVSDMIRSAGKAGFVPVAVISEPTRYVNQVYSFLDHVEDFWQIVSRNFPGIGAEELLSGMYHVILRKL
jgi:hypothetical protein